MKKSLLLPLALFCICAVSQANTNVGGTLSSDSTLTLINSPYVVTSTITVSTHATLTVDSGVVVQFNNNTGLTVLGNLIADNAKFTSINQSPSNGDWKGITIGNYSTEGSIQLTNNTIEYAITNYLYKGSATIANCIIQNSSADGLKVSKDFALILNATTITGNARPIYCEDWSNITVNEDNSLVGNTSDRVDIYSNSGITTDINLPTFDVPYSFLHNVTIKSGGSLSIDRDNTVLCFSIQTDTDAMLNIKSNTTIKVNGTYHMLNINGTLNAIADEGEHIYFTTNLDDNWGGDTNNDATATKPASKSWKGLYISGSGASNSQLIRCDLRFAGYDNNGGINITNSDPTLDECEITHNYFGIYIAESSNPTISNTTVASSDITPIAMSFEADPVFSNNTLSSSDNEYDAIGLIGGIMTSNGHIIKRDFTNIDNITYLILNKITVPETITLTIDPGIVIKADNGYNANKNIVIEGTLIANGTEAENIILTSARDDNHGNPKDTNKDGTTTTPTTNDCGAIVFAPTSTDNSSLSYCNIKYANGHRYENYYNQYVKDAAVITVNSSPNIHHNQIKDVYQGIRCYEASNAIINDNSVVNVISTPFAISPSASPTFSNNTFTNAGIIALGLLGGDMTQSGQISKTNIGGYENIAYCLLYDLTIKAATQLNINPGIVMKNDNSRITVEGGLKVAGTIEDKIIITSIKDDNCGNPTDANGDGNASAPMPGDWTMIRFEESSIDDSCLIENVEIRYAGRYYTGYNSYYFSTIEISNAGPQIKNTTIGQGRQYGIRIEGSSAPVISSTTVQNSEFEPIGMSLTSDPTFTDVTFTANRAKGLAIIDDVLSSDATLITRNVSGVTNIPYIINQTVRISADSHLEISPDVTIKFKKNYGSLVIGGALSANGTPDNNIIFTSLYDDSFGGDTNNDGNTTPPDFGDWYGITFESSALDSLNSLNNIKLRYAGYGYNDGAGITLDACYAKISNSAIELSKNFGIKIVGSAYPDITGNEFYNIEKSPISMSMFASPVFTGNSMSNVGRQSIQLIAETYSKDDTFIFRNFAGIDSISYTMLGNYTINDGTTLNIPAGMCFKTTERLYKSNNTPIYGASFIVNGTLNVLGSKNNPTVFTSFYDDTQGRPLDTGNDGLKPHTYYNSPWFIFNDISNDASVIDNALIKYCQKSIEINSASPIITSNSFTNDQRGIIMKGVSKPVIAHNTFHDLEYSPMSISLVAYPSTDVDNVISGSTYKVIEVNEETLTQDVTLTKRPFGGIANIPYYFNGTYTVGTGAILTIEPGVICKFDYYSQLFVEKGLIAQGGENKEDNIIFTHIADDFYGGDTNSDSTTTSYGDYYTGWLGIQFKSTAINSSCIIDHCTFKNVRNYSSYSAIEAISSSPNISNSTFVNVPNGVTAKGSANPTINNCDFYNMNYNAVNNVDQSFTLDATNNWWGDNSGPTHTSNAEGTGAAITDMVNYTPWKTQGANNPILGDVSLNGSVQAYDAALVLKSTVGTYTLSDEQKDVADVSGNQGADAITAYDASLILQYSVGLLNFFTATTLRSASIDNTTHLSMTNLRTSPEEEVVLPINIDHDNDIYAIQLKLAYDETLFENMEVEQTELSNGFSFISNIVDGVINISLAGTRPLSENGPLINLHFNVKENAAGQNSEISVLDFMKNEDQLASTINAVVVKVDGTSNLQLNNDEENNIKAYPNPFKDELYFSYTLKEASHVSIEVYNQLGQMVKVLTNTQQQPGQYSEIWTGDNNLGNRLTSGIYFIKYMVDHKEQVLKVQIQ